MNQTTVRSMADRKKPKVKLSGLDGNAFAIMARIRSALREVGWTKAEIASATDDMMSDGYDNLIVTACSLCDVE